MATQGFLFHAADYPDCPGIYLMRDQSERVLYVGKAKTLRRRLPAYFREDAPEKVRAMRRKIARIETICTRTEKEALLLEAELIKRHRPRYNVVLKDDKSFLLFRMSMAHPFPALSITRHPVRDGSLYFGPFTSAHKARTTWGLINRAFTLRKCSDRAFANRVRPCLQYHIKRCLGPCVHPVDPALYRETADQVVRFLRGKGRELATDLNREMRAASREMRFERAAELRDLIRAVHLSLESQAVVLPAERDLDAVGVWRGEERLGICQLQVREGRLADSNCFAWPGVGLPGERVVERFLLRSGEGVDLPPVILVPPGEADEMEAVEQVLAELCGHAVRIRSPRGTEERNLVRMAGNNAREQARRPGADNPQGDLEGVLGTKKAVWRVEGVDVSHLQGQGTVVGQVVFEGGLPARDQYRLYRFARTEGTADDYLALRLWAEARAAKSGTRPDLVLVDGGRGQLEAVWKAFANVAEAEGITVLSVAKGGRARGEQGDRFFLPGRKNPLSVSPVSREYRFLQRVRDEAHRFSIAALRKGHRRRSVRSGLLDIPGVGPATAKLLSQSFSSLEELADADAEKLAALPGIGVKKAAKIQKGINDLLEKESPKAS